MIQSVRTKLVLFISLTLIILLVAFLNGKKNIEFIQKTKPISQAPVFTQNSSSIFLIIMENTNWSSVKGNNISASYINSLLKKPDVSYADNYYNPPKLHPSEPNYIWMEAGDSMNLPNGEGTVNFTTDNDPSIQNSTSTKDHLVSYLTKKGIAWKVYTEGIDGLSCPLASNLGTKYAAKHIPVIFFQNITDNNSLASVNCIQHVRPYSELGNDMQNNTVGRYNIIVPDTCNDMHDANGCETGDSIKNGDNWLANNLPIILNSAEYKKNGLIFITWDEGSNGSDGPIGMVVLSHLAKGNGYHNAIRYDHSSLLKTLLETFGIVTYPRNTGGATDLRDLFRGY